jgi:hypothetical protein
MCPGMRPGMRLEICITYVYLTFLCVPFIFLLTAEAKVIDRFLYSNLCNFLFSQSFPKPFMQFLICTHVYLSFL